MSDSEKIQRLEKRLFRERAARQEAERLLEEKSLSLYETNRDLKTLSDNLENEVKQRTQQLSKALHLAEAGIQSRQHFLAMMSHEIRTPLHGILGLIDLLSLSPLNAEQADQVKTMRASGQSLLRLLNDILELSKVQSPTFALESEVINLEDIISGVIKLHAPLASVKQLTLVRESRGVLLPQLLGDGFRISQVLSNLLSNAIKFTKSGSVKISTEAELIDENRLSFRVLVRDTGIGIDPAKLPGLFNEFTQAEFNTHKQFGGTGLGLAISRKLVESMGGRLVARSQAGVGSEFEVNLEFEIVASQVAAIDMQSAFEQIIHAQCLQNLSVLVVDDNLVNRTLLSAFLKRLKVDCRLASDGQEAVEIIKNSAPIDLIFMDLVMPCIDGLEATRQIRLLPIKQPFICGLSANAFDSDKEACTAQGMNHFLDKPLSFEKFCIFLQTAIDQIVC
jgi:two-component system, sensor histidine kinase